MYHTLPKETRVGVGQYYSCRFSTSQHLHPRKQGKERAVSAYLCVHILQAPYFPPVVSSSSSSSSFLRLPFSYVSDFDLARRTKRTAAAAAAQTFVLKRAAAAWGARELERGRIARLLFFWGGKGQDSFLALFVFLRA